MKIILLEDVKSLGKKGDIVDVNEGYARNCILKKNLGFLQNYIHPTILFYQR